MGLQEQECLVTEEALDTLVREFANTEGIRDLEQAAEHLVANALYQIEVDHVKQVVFDTQMVKNLLS